MKKCEMCNCLLIEGNPGNIYGTKKGMQHISKHHLFPQRFTKYFSKKEIHKNFSIVRASISATLCYECHEEILHNIVFNKAMIKKIKLLLKGKDKKEKIQLMHNIVKQGINSKQRNITLN